MDKNIDKLKDLALYMAHLRKISTENSENTNNVEVNKNLIAANVKIQDATKHLEKAFNILMKE